MSFSHFLIQQLISWLIRALSDFSFYGFIQDHAAWWWLTIYMRYAPYHMDYIISNILHGERSICKTCLIQLFHFSSELFFIVFSLFFQLSLFGFSFHQPSSFIGVCLIVEYIRTNCFCKLNRRVLACAKCNSSADNYQTPTWWGETVSHFS